jgi:serpin B
MKALTVGLIAAVSLSLASCSDESVSPEADAPRQLTIQEQNLVGAYNDFGFRLIREIVAQADSVNNIFTSPLSASMALGMTLNGAASTTEEAMKQTLGFAGMDMTAINESYESLMDLLTGLDPEVRFDIANSIWYRFDRGLEQSFFDVCSTYFDARVTGMDFSDPGAAATINAWVAASTENRIREIVDDPISALTVMFLINAIYFDGTWTASFDPDLTEDGTFTLPDGSAAPCRMMAHTEPGELSAYSYLETDLFQAVDLPYADGWFSMTVLLPKSEFEANEIIMALDPAIWSGWMAGLETREGRLELPRFELDYKLKMNDVLSAMGMGIAFGDGADFTRMRTSGGLWINEVRHKTFVKVDEAGTEAAAVTSVEIWERENPETFEMRVDRPFVMAIREKHSGTVLFIGRIGAPGYN